ncbi:TIGR02677 family protein [Pseudonocardia oroxyli]|uniref:TIGR02677 family protein n=1 Tax=Pseudonocardia oroxyli TaxID=366584 RepID=A0A1G7ZQG4_PSEOR|nr:TIGR02677 family protein [Pseudonocardia oroxyli]SDH11002.1 TIGR02677 family protein [Pseudonocardia oroxyli]
MDRLHRVPTDLFRFTHGDRADLYSAVLQAFGEANDRLETSLKPEQVRERLRGVGWFAALEDDDLVDALASLRRWQLVEATQDHAGDYRTAEEYEQRNVSYTLTRRGEAALAGVEHALEVLSSAGALQTAVLHAVADRLGALGALLEDGAAPNRAVFAALMELEHHLEALRANTRQFNGELQRLVRVEGVDLSVFHEVKAATVAYLQEFLGDLDRRALAVAAGTRRVESFGIEDLWRRALAGADLPPSPTEDRAVAWVERRRVRWSGLRAWFLPEDGSAARIDQLHTVSRRAVVALLQALDRITESRKRVSSASEDFRELARGFAAAPGEEDCHRLWSVAFGLGSARHAHLAHPDPELVSPSTSWREAPPVPVSALLRSSGRTERHTRPGRVRDVAVLRAERAERARQERAQADAAWAVLAGSGPVSLSSFGRLDHGVFLRLLELLGRALSSAAGSDGRRRAVTADGRMEIVLSPPAAGTASAVLLTPRGRFEGPDYLVDIRHAGRARGRHRAVAAR